MNQSRQFFCCLANFFFSKQTEFRVIKQLMQRRSAISVTWQVRNPSWTDSYCAGLYHDVIPQTLLEGRAPVLHQHHEQKHDVWRTLGEEDLGARRLLRALEEILHPRHHNWEHHAEGFPRWPCSLQSEVGANLTLDLYYCFINFAFLIIFFLSVSWQSK